MFARLSLLARHVSPATPRAAQRITMAAAANANAQRKINTAACLIIGDEVLNGKVSCATNLNVAACANEIHRPLMYVVRYSRQPWKGANKVDKLGIHGQMVLFNGNCESRQKSSLPPSADQIL